MKVNFRNLAENLIIVIVTTIAVGYTVNKTTIKSMETALETQKQAIIESIKKETTKIEHNLNNTFEKKSFKKGEDINIVIDPSSNSVISNLDSTQALDVKTEKGFFKRLFKRD